MVNTADPATDMARRRTPGSHVANNVPALRWVGTLACLIVGALVIWIADRNAAHSTGSLHFALFWLGILLGLAGVVTTAMDRRSNARDHVLLVVLFGAFTFVPKLLLSPWGPDYFDEYGHLRHVQDMVATGHVVVPNAFLPVVQYYPGLGLLTEAVHYVTRLNLWHSGQVVILAAHCGALLLIRAVAIQLDRTSVQATFAAIIFAANPSFMYFDSQYAYESLAIALALAAALLCLRARRAVTTRAAWRNGVAGAVLGVSTVFTHHISAFVAAVLMILISVFVPRRVGEHEAHRSGEPAAARRAANLGGAWVAAGVTTIICGVYVLAFAGSTKQYLLPSARRGIQQMVDRLTGGAGPTGASTAGGGGAATGADTEHSPFAGASIPSYEHYVAVATPFLVLVLVAVNLYRIARADDRWYQLRLGAPFILFTFGYFLSLPLALTAGGNEASHRAWPFTYLGVAVIGVWSLGRPRSSDRPTRHRSRGPRGWLPALTIAALLALNMGNIVAGTNTIYRFPGPYVFGSDGRFRTPELAGVVRWADTHLPAHAKVVTDRFTSEALLGASDLDIPSSTEAYADAVYLSPTNPTAELRGFLRDHGVRYFILDRRILTTDPAQTFFQDYLDNEDSINSKQLATLDRNRNGFTTLLHSTRHYSVYELHP